MCLQVRLKSVTIIRVTTAACAYRSGATTRATVIVLLSLGRRAATVFYDAMLSSHVLDTALLEWISESAVRAYSTLGSAVSYLNHAQRSHDCSRKL